VLGWTGTSADAGRFGGEPEPAGLLLSDGWAEAGVPAGIPEVIPCGIPAVAVCAAVCMAGSAKAIPAVGGEAGVEATVCAAATVVVLCGAESDVLSSEVLDCELSSAALVAVTVCDAAADGAEP
jgi:hypothetical protein